MPSKSPRLYELDSLRSVTGQTLRPGGLELTARALSFCRFPQGALVLDVGCGLGATVQYLRTAYLLEAVGVDASPELVGQGLKLDPELPLMPAEAENLPFPADFFDGLVCECVLSLLKEPDTALAEFRRVLKTEGLLLLTDVYARQAGFAKVNRAATTGSEVGGAFSTTPVECCLQGAISRPAIEEIVRKNGFLPLRWEDQTRYLQELAARLVFYHGSLKAFWDLSCGGNCRPDTSALISEAKPGYYLLIARKMKDKP